MKNKFINYNKCLLKTHTISRKLALLFIITFGFLSNSYSQKTTLEPKGIFKEIDVTRHNSIITALFDKDEKIKQSTINNIIKNPNYYNPPVIYALSKVLFSQEKKDEAAFWFYVAQLRARYDANLCMDNSAKQVVSTLNNMFGPDINKCSFQDLTKLETIVNKVIEFVRTNKENYDHRWINLSGMWAIQSASGNETQIHELSQPKEAWTGIKKKTIDDYYNGFTKYLNSMKK